MFPLLLFISALSVCAQPTANSLPPLVPAYGEIPPTFWEQHQAAIIVSGFAFLAVALLVLRRMLRPKAVIVLPPETVARQALAGLQGRPEKGTFLSEISQILRRYLCAAFGLPSAEMTTAEFCTTLATSEKIGADLARTISSFLHECDERKFSPASSAAPFNAMSRASELISLAEKRMRSAPVPGAATSPVPAALVKQNPLGDSDAAASGDGHAP